MEGDVFFSVIIPVYNKFPHLERSIYSVLNQTYPNFELILIDNASTDGSSEKLQEFVSNKIKLIKRSVPGPGGYAARNLGIREARFDWICFLDADDKWDSDLLENLNQVIRSQESLGIIAWGYFFVNNGKKIVDPYSKKFSSSLTKPFKLIDYFAFPRPIWTGAVAIKKEILESSGMFPEGKCERGGDVDTWIRCLMISPQNLWINKQLSYYYTDSVNMITKTIDDMVPYYVSTVKEISDSTNDKKLKSAISDFINTKLYGVALRKIKSGKGVPHSLFWEFDFKALNTYVIFIKIYIKYFINNLP
jgi:glycosyltransferase involved in cell wall biosynthesis